MSLTLEQQAIIDCLQSNDSNGKVVTVNAIAGSGKSTTSRAIVETLRPNKGFYTAFNKAIVTDTAEKLGSMIDARTIHSLAYRYVNPTKVRELTYLDIEEDLDYAEKRELLDAIDSFYRSQYISLEDYLEDNISTYLHDYVDKYVNCMYNGRVAPSFNYLLKCFHLMLVDGDVDLDLDLFILDECQDVSGVMLEIFKHAKAKKKVMLGDTFQNIYAYLNTVNGFNLLRDNTIPFNLTQSFRCNTDIADQVQTFGKQYLSENFIFRGIDVESNNSGITYLSRTNAQMIVRMYKLIQQDEYFYCHKSIDDIFALPFALIAANNGRPVYKREYQYLAKEKEKWLYNGKPAGTFFNYLTTLEIVEVDGALSVLQSLKDINLFELKEQIKNRPTSKSIELSTVHAYKGLENDTIILEQNIANNFRKHITNLKPDRDLTLLDRINSCQETRQECNLYYVALSRAKHNLNILNK